MANLKLVFMITRPLEKEHVTSYEMGTVVKDNTVMWRRSMIENAADSRISPRDDDGGVEKWVDDFRPTDPGHSPGAGHYSPTPKDASNGAPRP
ncbi:hypothetical protein CR513_43109, partial [Mucuna pruriens]